MWTDVKFLNKNHSYFERITCYSICFFLFFQNKVVRNLKSTFEVEFGRWGCYLKWQSSKKTKISLTFTEIKVYLLCVTFVFLGRGDTCKFGVNLVVLWDLQYSGAVLYHPCQQIRSPWNLKDMLDVWQVIWKKRLLAVKFTDKPPSYIRHVIE